MRYGKSVPDSYLLTMKANRPKQVDALAALGLGTVADLEAIDSKTLEVSAAGASNAAVQIELARARVGTAPAYRKRRLDSVTVHRADIEVDVDMENTNDGCYLWGALVTDRRGAAPAVRYMPFVTWDPDIEAGELLRGVADVVVSIAANVVI